MFNNMINITRMNKNFVLEKSKTKKTMNPTIIRGEPDPKQVIDTDWLTPIGAVGIVLALLVAAYIIYRCVRPRRNYLGSFKDLLI